MLQRLRNLSVRDVPQWLQPALFGVALVLAFALSREALVVVPVLLLVVLLAHPTPGHAIMVGVLVYTGVLLGAAVGGLAYTFVGQHLRRLPVIGSLLAGTVSAFPYAASLLLAMRGLEGTPLGAPVAPAEWLATLLVAPLIGGVLAYAWREDAQEPDGE